MAKATTQYGILDTVAQRVTPTAHDPQGAKPSITVDAHAGTSATAALSGDSTDFAGKITLVTGSAGWAAGSQLKVLFGAGGTVDSGAATSNFFYSVNSVQA
jgi:hypothetical protein